MRPQTIPPTRAPANRNRRAFVALTIWVLAAALASPAQAATPAAVAKTRLRRVERRLDDARRDVRDLRRALVLVRGRVRDAGRRSVTADPGSVRRRGFADPVALARRVRVAALRADRERLRRRVGARADDRARLARRRRRIDAHLRSLPPIGVCPVRGAVAVSDDFGASRWDDGRYHAHQGNDIAAPPGTPIVAPFDGMAIATSSSLGGIGVKVVGNWGYVYNAHLSGYGRLGRVSSGTVIGYVGATGNATGPTDHFEWHPQGGPAVDPNRLLSQVC